MSQVRFNHVFVGLMGLGVISAYAIPPWITERAKGKADALLYPVSKPVRAIAAAMNEKYGSVQLPPGQTRERNRSEISIENEELRQEVAWLTQQLDALKLVEAENKRLGKMLDYFKQVDVIGGDSSPGRESLSLAPATGVNTSVDAPVICLEGLVGRFIEGGRVRLVTDASSTVIGEFGRFEHGKWVTLSIPRASVRGIGNGAMKVDHLTMKDVEGLKVGDWVVVDDKSVGVRIQARPIGVVESIKPLASKPLFAEIRIVPRTDLRKLTRVLVMKK